MISEEGTELIGHLVGLNCIDANLCMKGDDLDNQVRIFIVGSFFFNHVPVELRLLKSFSSFVKLLMY